MDQRYNSNWDLLLICITSHGHNLLDVSFQNSGQPDRTGIRDTIGLPPLNHYCEPRVAEELPEHLVYKLVQGNGEKVQPLVDPSPRPRDTLQAKQAPRAKLTQKKVLDFATAQRGYTSNRNRAATPASTSRQHNRKMRRTEMVGAASLGGVNERARKGN